MGLVEYPIAAAYLVQNYERLEGRVFEKKRFTHMGKQWYEYHRPRDRKLMLSKKRILSPTLAKQVRFSLDTTGYLSDHACLYLQPTSRTRVGYSQIREQLACALGRHISREDVLKYCLAFLNSAFAQKCLVTGHRPRPGEVYAMTESVLREILIPPPPNKKTAKVILDLVTDLVRARDEKEIARLEDRLAGVVNRILKPLM